MKQLTAGNYLDSLELTVRPYHKDYYAMYSSVLDGVLTDPALMAIPIDDHVVHRGDGVFETFKCVDGAIYNMRAHLDRLETSAKHLGLSPSRTIDDMGDIVTETIRAGNQRDCLVRVLLTRGPGGMGVDPYQSKESQLYVIVYRLKQSFMQLHPDGARARTSSVHIKDPFLATAKTCNYLVNMLMKKEAADAGVDFVIAFDDNGLLAEGATENVGIVTRDNRLQFPKLENILAGTTMLRTIELAASLVQSGDLASVDQVDISRDVLAAAPEILITGTTRDVSAVVEFNGDKVGDGAPGPVFRKLSELLLCDIRKNAAIRTPVFI